MPWCLQGPSCRAAAARAKHQARAPGRGRRGTRRGACEILFAARRLRAQSAEPVLQETTATAEPRRVFSGKTCASRVKALLRAAVLWKTLLAGRKHLINISFF